jgi:hypothetical protein
MAQAMEESPRRFWYLAPWQKPNEKIESFDRTKSFGALPPFKLLIQKKIIAAVK